MLIHHIASKALTNTGLKGKLLFQVHLYIGGERCVEVTLHGCQVCQQLVKIS